MPALGAERSACEPVPRLVDLIPHYLAELRTTAGDEHFRTTSRQLNRIMRELATWHPLEVLQYRRRRLAEGVSNRTANMDIGALRACLNWAVELGLIDDHRVGRIKALPQREGDKRRLPHPLTDDEYQRFIEASRREDTGRAFAQTPLWRTLLQGSIRWGDALAMRPGCIVDDVLTVVAQTTKGKRMRQIPLPPDLVAELVLPFRTPKGALWRKSNEKNARRMLYRTLQKAGIERVDAAGRRVFIHALRATAATTMLRRGVSLPAVSTMLGHMDPALTARLYVRLDVDALRKEVGKAWG